jgi:transaldolase
MNFVNSVNSVRNPLPVKTLPIAIPNVELLWASPRELFNLIQADEIGCHIITMTNDLIAKIPLLGKNHDKYALETVKMFARDSEAAGYRL